MAIVQERIGNLIRTYSDQGFKIHGGMPEGDYDEAMDPAEFNRTYTETNIPIESPDEEEQQSSDAEEIVNILTGE